MDKAIDKLRENYLTENELAEFFNVDAKRIRDLRSYHVNGKCRFIEHIKPTSKCILYRYEDVVAFLESSYEVDSFGKACNDPDLENDQ
jgi:hypothetical protein